MYTSWETPRGHRSLPGWPKPRAEIPSSAEDKRQKELSYGEVAGKVLEPARLFAACAPSLWIRVPAGVEPSPLPDSGRQTPLHSTRSLIHAQCSTKGQLLLFPERLCLLFHTIISSDWSSCQRGRCWPLGPGEARLTAGFLCCCFFPRELILSIHKPSVPSWLSRRSQVFMYLTLLRLPPGDPLEVGARLARPVLLAALQAAGCASPAGAPHVARHCQGLLGFHVVVSTLLFVL